MIRAALLVLVACTPAAQPMPTAHPANPAAPTGRLAGPPSALRPGVVEQAPKPHTPAPPAPQGHEGHK